MQRPRRERVVENFQALFDARGECYFSSVNRRFLDTVDKTVYLLTCFSFGSEYARIRPVRNNRRGRRRDALADTTAGHRSCRVTPHKPNPRTHDYYTSHVNTVVGGIVFRFFRQHLSWTHTRAHNTVKPFAAARNFAGLTGFFGPHT